MAALFNTLDKQFGENGHVEYSSKSLVLNLNNDTDYDKLSTMQERITQFSFQLTRAANKQVITALEQKLFGMLGDLRLVLQSDPTRSDAHDYFITLFKMIGHTRDIIDGKGEYTLSYMMIYVWNEFWPALAQYALRLFVLSDPVVEYSSSSSSAFHPFGSWKDIKYLCNYLKTKKHDIVYSPLINYAINLMNDQIRADNELYLRKCAGEDVGAAEITLAAKWAPREKSAQFGWLFCELARAYFYIYECTADTPNQKLRAIVKCKTDYRKTIASLNIYLDTVQIKQCANTWASILPESQTSITMHKQKNAFLNKTKKGATRSTAETRVVCAKHFEAYVEKAVKGEVEVKGKRIGLNDFTKQALEYNKGGPAAYSSQMALLNAQWKNNATQTGALGKMIAMVDVSGSMDGDPMNCAIALGVRVAEKSLLGRRVMTFSASPSWVNLDKCDDFCSCVREISKADWGMNTNFYAALDMILSAIVSARLPAEEVEDMVLAIFSDMQIDAASSERSHMDTMFDNISKKYAQAGIQTCGQPYKHPHILFWNLRSTTGSPSLSSQKNTSMMSGFSPALLNSFCEQGLATLQSFNPYTMLISQLNNKRYDCMEQKAQEIITQIIATDENDENDHGDGWC